MSAGIILLAAIVCAFVAAAVSLAVVLYIREGQQDAEPYEIAARGWWSDNTTYTVTPGTKDMRDRLMAALDDLEHEFDHDAVQLAADQGCEIEPNDMVRDGLGGQS